MLVVTKSFSYIYIYISLQKKGIVIITDYLLFLIQISKQKSECIFSDNIILSIISDQHQIRLLQLSTTNMAKDWQFSFYYVPVWLWRIAFWLWSTTFLLFVRSMQVLQFTLITTATSKDTVCKQVSSLKIPIVSKLEVHKSPERFDAAGVQFQVCIISTIWVRRWHCRFTVKNDSLF